MASLRVEGVGRQPQSGFSAKIGKTATLMLTTEPLRFLRKHLPYPRYRAAEEDIATSLNLAIQLLYLLHFNRTHKLHCVFANATDLNHRPLPANVFPCVATR